MAKQNRSDWTLNGVPANVEKSPTGRPKATEWKETGKDTGVFQRASFVMVRENVKEKTADFVQVKQYKTDSYADALKLAGGESKRAARLLCKGINAFGIEKAKKGDAQVNRMVKILAEQRGISEADARKELAKIGV